MANIMNAVPASLRQTVPVARASDNLRGRGQRPVFVAGPAARAAALSKSRFSRLPQEPEDARLTGVTRSLTRRLLALNLRGTFTEKSLVIESRIA